MSLADDWHEPRLVPFLAHKEPLYMALGPFLMVGIVLLHDPYSLALVIVSVLSGTAVIRASHRHQFHYLCPRCAAATPLNGPEAAERHQRMLYATHWLLDNRRKGMTWLRTGYSVVMVVALYALLLARAPWWALLLPGVAIYALWAAEAWLRLRHRPLQPWCKLCGWGDGGGDEEVVPDVPVPHADGVR